MGQNGDSVAAVYQVFALGSDQRFQAASSQMERSVLGTLHEALLTIIQRSTEGMAGLASEQTGKRVRKTRR